MTAFSWEFNMFSRISTQLLFFGIMFGTGACGYFFAEPTENRKERTAHIDVETTECLQKTDETFGNYFSREKDETGEWAECVIQAIERFQSVTTGASDGIITFHEIVNVLNELVLKEKIESNLVEKFKNLKQAVLGGNRNSFTNAEIKNAKKFLRLGAEHLDALYPFMDLFLLKETLDPNLKKDRQKIEKAFATLDQAAKELGTKFTGSGRATYPLDEFWELLQMTGNEKFSKFISEKNQYFNSLKSLVVHPPADRINPKNWYLLFSGFSRGFKIKTKFHYLLKDENLFQNFSHMFTFVSRLQKQLQFSRDLSGQKMDDLQDLVEETTRLVETSLTNHPHNKISAWESGVVFAAEKQK